MPGIKRGAVKTPAEDDITFVATPVASLVTLTATPGITAPLGSVTIPVIVPRLTCAHAALAISVIPMTNKNNRLRLNIRLLLDLSVTFGPTQEEQTNS